jgi:alcohol dehydrogenase
MAAEPTCEPGRILGHEAVGTVVETGAAVGLKPGDRVPVSCISACGRGRYCRTGMYGQCQGGGWILGHRIDGTQAEYVRVPFADTSTHLIPWVSDEAVLMLADILPLPTRSV